MVTIHIKLLIVSINKAMFKLMISQTLIHPYIHQASIYPRCHRAGCTLCRSPACCSSGCEHSATNLLFKPSVGTGAKTKLENKDHFEL